MATSTITKKSKNIDLPIETLQKLSLVAAAQGKSLKAYIEDFLISKANSVDVKISEKSYPDLQS